MNTKHFWGMAQIGLLVMAASFASLAQEPQCQTFSGVLNGYSPQSGTTGPYEVRGPWSLTIHGDTGKASFSAAVNMELSDGWVITRNNGDFDPSARGAHTHHITLVGGDVTELPDGGIRVTGTATVTLNGGTAPISPTPLEIDITGGTKVKYSNVALTFGVPGSNHFGTSPLPGVVRHVSE